MGATSIQRESVRGQRGDARSKELEAEAIVASRLDRAVTIVKEMYSRRWMRRESHQDFQDAVLEHGQAIVAAVLRELGREETKLGKNHVALRGTEEDEDPGIAGL
jgi:hypothetical protein